MTVLVTGVAGFIGMHVALALQARGETVVGVDDLNDYYDPALKRARLECLAAGGNFTFHRADISDRAAIEAVFTGHAGIDRVVHLAAQAGVRRSLEDPYRYVTANVMGHLVMMEACRARADSIRHLVYASSSSVYGSNTKQPFAESDPVDAPMSLYAATKRSDELMSQAYVSLFGMPMTGLRFFTVYGPWGRPDMAVWIFTEAILRGEPIRVVDGGRVERDFTYIDDIVAGVVAALDHPPRGDDGRGGHRLYNLGNTKPESLTRLIALIEGATGRQAEIVSIERPAGDVPATWADVDRARTALGYVPSTALETGLQRFVDWYGTWCRRSHT